MTSHQPHNKARHDALASLSDIVRPLVKPSAFTAAMGAIDSTIQVDDTGRATFNIDGVSYGTHQEAVRMFFLQPWAAPMLAPGARLPSSPRATRSGDYLAEKTLAQLHAMGRTDAFDERPPARAPRVDAADPAERTLAQLHAMGVTDAFSRD